MASETFLVASLGSIGRRHAANLRALRPDARIVGLRATSTNVGETACDAYVDTLAAALGLSPVAAIIASPAPFHAATATGLLRAGVPILCEKPLAASLEDARAIAQAAREAAAPAMVGYNLRFSAAIMKTKRLLDEGAAGDVALARLSIGQYLPDWRPGQDYRRAVSARAELGGGPLLELSHEIDLACWFFGVPDTVFCAGGRLSALEIDTPDAVELTLSYAAPRRIVSVGLNFLDRAPRRGMTLVGTDATIELDGIAQSVAVQDGPGSTAHSADFADCDRNHSYFAELEHFLGCVQSGATPQPSVGDGLAAMRVIEAARRSMETGASVRLKDIDDT